MNGALCGHGVGVWGETGVGGGAAGFATKFQVADASALYGVSAGFPISAFFLRPKKPQKSLPNEIRRAPAGQSLGRSAYNVGKAPAHTRCRR
jgi:hypothetical protein